MSLSIGSDEDLAELADGAVLQQFPPTPEITDVNWQPPDETPWVPRASTARLMLQANSVHHNWFAWVADQPNADEPWPNLIGFNAEINGGLPADYTLTLRSKLVLLKGSYASVTAPNETSRTCSATYGISTTDETTISSEVGVEAGGLSAKISASFSYSVTTSQETLEEKTWSVQAPEGMTRIWMLWQVVDELVALDPSGNVIGNPTRRGWANFVDEGPDDAFLNYASVSQTFPSSFLRVGTKDFPTP